MSGIGGDKTQTTWNNSQDFWMIKTDMNGSIQWDKDFGGTDIEDEFTSIFLAQDKGYIIAGNSYSDITGNKTENNLGIEQSWVLKLDSTGGIEWDKTPLTSGHDEIGLVVETKEGCIVISNSTYGDIAGEKTQDNWGAGSGADYWMIKLCDSLLSPHAAFNAPHHLCPGTCASFTNLSLYATSCIWSFPGATPNSSTDIDPTSICYNTPGNYDVSLIASSSFGSDTITLSNYITVYPYPAPQGITQSGDTLFAIAGATSYQWYYNGNSINGATGYFYVASASGDYNVVATDNNGCEVEAAIFSVVAGLTPALSKGERVTAYPNPVFETLTVISYPLYVAADRIEISVYNVLGEMVMTAPYQTTSNNSKLFQTSFNVSVLPPGLYYFELNSAEKKLRGKFVKQ